MPSYKELQKLRGLNASDRTAEEQRAINQQMGYKEAEEPITVPSIPSVATPEVPTKQDTVSSYMLNNALKYKRHLDEQYEQALAERQEEYGVGRNSSNTNINEYLDSVANNASSYYKKYKGTDKLPITDQESKELAAAYDARKETYGQQNADVWLDKYMKDKVGQNQSWWEQATNAVSHLIPAIEGGLIQTYGMLHGTVGHIIGAEGYRENEDLNWFDSFVNDVIDNPVTRYGRDIEMAGTSHVSDVLHMIGLTDKTANDAIAAMKGTATQYNPEGIGNDAIVTTSEQDDSWISSATPWQALQAGGFTALSMMTGAAEAKAAGWLFNGLAKGVNAMNKANRIIKTEKALEKTLTGLKKAQNFTDIAVIPGMVGSVEGAMEGLNTKIEVERNAIDNLDNYYKELVGKEAEELYNSEELNPIIEVQTDQGKAARRMYATPEEAFKEVWDKHKDEYTEARRQIDWASSKAGVQNFWANSMINGMMNTTFKAGLMAPRVQETLRNSKLTGWAYKNPKFNVDELGKVTPKMSKAGAVAQVLKEPFGEGMEEYMQSLSNDVFSGAAENNINEFIKNKFESDGTAKIAESFGSDWAAALTALKGSIANKESIESAILGAVSSTMGTVGGIGRGYHRAEDGSIVRNSLLDPRNLTRGYKNENGEVESMIDYLRRVTPWRSGLINAYFDRRREQSDANEAAATLTEWIKDPQNRAKWDGLTGTANWITQMENAAESNDQFSYRKAQMGKAVNDVFMLSKLKGTDYYDSVVTDLQKASSMDVDSQEAQDMIAKIKQNGGEEYQDKSDEEIVEKIKSNANQMLGLMTTVEKEGRNLERLLGRVDEDTKQSLIYGKIMEEDFSRRKDQLQEEIDTIKSRIQNSTRSSNVNLTDEQKALIMKYGTLNKALKAHQSLVEEGDKLDKRIEELEKIDPEKTTDKQKEELVKSKAALKEVYKELKAFEGLKDEEGDIDHGLSQLVLNEEEIMNLDPTTRAMVLAQGATKLYNATHQDRQKVDQLNLELDEINHQIDALEAQKKNWTTSDGRAKKHHTKQVTRNNQKIAELQKQKDTKMRQLDAEQGKQNTKPVYNSAQQAVIDNLVQQGMAQDNDFLDKVIDMGRLEKGIKDYHTQYQAILSDPNAFHNYVQRAKYNAQRNLTRRRAERIAGIQNYQEYAQELDRITANASQQEVNEIMQTLRREDAKQKKQYQQDNMVVDPETGDMVEAEAPKTNFDRYSENVRQQADLVRQFAKNPNLTNNDQSLLLDAMQYLSSQGIDVTDREAAVQALIEKDEQGNIGGKFRQFVEAKNEMVPAQQRTTMPVFTSIGQVVGQYVDLLNGAEEDAINRGNIQPTIISSDDTTPTGATVVSTPSTPSSPSAPEQPQATATPTIFNIGGTTPESGHFVDNDGTVATSTQTQAMQEHQKEPEVVEKSELQQAFEQVTTPEIATMVNASANTIINSNESEEVKNLAGQYLEDIAVNGNETFSTVDDLLTAIQEQVNRLKEMSNQQEDADNDFSKAAGLLQKVYGSLSAKKLRGRRTLPTPQSRPDNPNASVVRTANIAWMERNNPDAWAVQFTNDHAIDEWNRDHVIDRDTPIYFITDSEWSAEVTKQMTPSAEVQSINPNHRKYDTLTDMPVVAAVRVETPQNPATTTAIEVDGLWYQPIGVMPSTKAKGQGAARTFDIRKKASQQQGRHLVTENGLPNGNPLTTRVYGANYLTMHHPDASGDKRQNTIENNTEVQTAILKTLPEESRDRLRAMPKNEMLNDSEYLNARNKFLNGLAWNSDENNPTLNNQLTFIPDNRREGETGSPMIVFTIPMSDTVERTGNRTLADVLENGTGEEVRSFNSRTQRLYDEVIRPMFQFLQQKDRGGDKSAKVITQEDLDANPNAYQDEAERLTKLLNGYEDRTHGISDFIYIQPNAGWSIKVTAPQQEPSTLDNPTTFYKVFFINQDSSIAPIEIATIRAGQKDADAALEMLRNLMWDNQTGQIRDFLNWQVPKPDAQNINNPDKTKGARARQNYAAIVDDGILSVAGSSIVYDVDGVSLAAPIASDGRIVYPSDNVVNKVNAQPAAPQNNTPQGDGAITTTIGQSIEPDSGASLTNTPSTQPRESEKLKKVKEITGKIIADSKEFALSKDESHYYIIVKATGEQIKYLRVTTVIGADESAPQWEPSIEDILNKLRERHSIATDVPTKYNSIDAMSSTLGIAVGDIRRAIAELRTEHKKGKYGAWSVPSTAVGNTADIITRDFLAGNLKTTYPNITKEALGKFTHQLELFKADLDSRGIHIVPEGIMAHGKITMTDAEGNNHEVNVAGTLDLFGYDEDGNFYIFDMKTTRDHSDDKLLKEKDKWSRQISMYADLLKQSYPGFEVSPENLRIIPINVEYPTPKGSRGEHLDPNGPQYLEVKSGPKKGQLQMKYRGRNIDSNIGPETKMDIWAGTNPSHQELSNLTKRPFTLQLFAGEAPIQFNSVEQAFQYTKFRLLSQFLGFEKTKPFLLSDQKLTGEEYKDNVNSFVRRGVKAATLRNGTGLSAIGDSYEEEKGYIEEQINKILNAKDGFEAKRLGGKSGGYTISGHSGSTFLDTIWSGGELVAEDVMKAAMKASFEQNEDALNTLFNTGNATLTHNKGGDWKEAMPRLLMEVREELRSWVDFNGSNLEMRTTDINTQFKPGYTPFNISWDNLSSEDQDIADALATQTPDETLSAEQAPQQAQIETPRQRKSTFMAQDAVFDDSQGTQDAAPAVPPITPSGQSPVLPSWRNLTNAQKQALADVYGIEDVETYNEYLDDPATAEGIRQDLKCRGVM